MITSASPTSRAAFARIFLAVFTACCLVCLSGLVNPTMASAQVVEPRYNFDVPAGEAKAMLRQFAAQAKREIVFAVEAVEGIQTNAVKGEMTAQEAVDQLLADTGLVGAQDKTGAFAIRKQTEAERKNGQRAIAKREQSDRPSVSRLQIGDDERRAEVLQLDVFSVTGTRIRGGQPASTIVTIHQEEMRLSGHINLGEVARAMPQNFSGGQNPGVAVGATTGASNANANLTGGSSFNLRGLGPDATLTLLNGSRLPYDGSRQATDVSVIPVAAIERVEILLDGASAIYGSDAVGGVANIVLKRDYEGAEFSARFGVATDGGYEQEQYTGVAGTNWGSGGFLITGDYSVSGSIRAKQRDYLSQLTNQNVTIYPRQTQKGGLLSGHQKIGALGRLNLDAFYTKRAQENLEQTDVSSLRVVDLDSSIWGISPSINIALQGEWSARLHGAFGRNRGERVTTSVSVASGLQTGKLFNEYFGDMHAAGIELEGPVFALPAGDMRASIGGGYRENSLNFKTVNLISGAVSGVLAGDDRSHHIFGEVNLPLISGDQHIPLVTILSLNAALRHENYDSFGTSTTPKIGAIWGLTPGFDIKASWGKSFKVPTLGEQFAATSLALYPGSFFGGPAGSQVLALFGSVPSLTPEKAEITTAGFVTRPKILPGLRIEFGYFDIDYTDRVSLPIDNTFAALSNPVYAEFVTRVPTIAQQNAAFAPTGLPVGTFLPGFNAAGAPYDPAQVIAILDGRLTNASSHRIKGVDLNLRYTTELLDGNLLLSGNGTWITKGVRKLTSLAPEQQVAGVNFWPAKFKGRVGAGWSRNGFSLNANINHIAGVVDRSTTPNVKRSSMTTLDLVVDYQAKLPVVGDIGFNLALMNLLNETPPYLQPPLLPNFVVNYDSTNYSALGRVVSATVTKRF
ncbi:MAG TPA: TonB-dependent receptor [Hyphomonas sp.]|nr:TonB-dependent receptor [Hyphomonas sp.]HRJ46128.1 TonB-dependent receptor [Opitutaceae bacterium]